MSSLTPMNDASGSGDLTIALIGPDEPRLRAVAGVLAECQIGDEGKGHQRQIIVVGAGNRVQHRPLSGAEMVIHEYPAYPADVHSAPKLDDEDYDVLIIDLDSDPEYALNVVKSVSTRSTSTVMVYSARPDVDLVVRSMRAGAREFLNLPLTAGNIADALSRVSVKPPAPRQAKKPSAKKLYVFLGSKGGCGVTTIASNFAVSLAQESGSSTLLIDLGVPLGDVAINLGMVPKYSTANALSDTNRLDGSFLTSLLAKHSSGLHVLAAPTDFPNTQSTNGAIDKMLAVARQGFENVVIDAGSRVDLKGTTVFDDSAMIYLITQVGISEMRNANRMIAQLFGTRINSLQVVLNRYAPRALGFDEEHITKALTRQAQWKIPDDYAAARRTQNTAVPLALEDSPISKAIRHMARTACGLADVPEKKKRFGIFG
jgi:pilus assembly protein CpaE